MLWRILPAETADNQGMGLLTLEPHADMGALRRARPPTVQISLLSDSEFADWDRFIATARGGTFFHTTAWMQSVRHAFGHRPVYLFARQDRKIVSVLPLFEIRSLLGGTMLVSVPYAIYGGVLGLDDKINRKLLDEAAGIANRVGANCLELRCEHAAWSDLPTINRYATFRKSLPTEREGCLAALPRKARAAARAARDKHGLLVSADDRHLPTVWRLYCGTMRRLGSLNYPYAFFDELVSRTPGQHVVSMVTRGGEPVAGLVTFVFQGVAMPYFVGATPAARSLNAYNLIYLTAMQNAVDQCCHTFDFGRSRLENVGACAFKKNQGFTATPLRYQTMTTPGRHAPNLTPSNPKFSLARRVWPAIPMWVTRPLGAWLSKHIPG